MPIQRFKTFKQAEEALWNFKPDNEYFQRVRELFETVERIKGSTPKQPRSIRIETRRIITDSDTDKGRN